FTPLGRAPMPAPSANTIERLATGLEDSQWIEIEGTVRAMLPDTWVHHVTPDLVKASNRFLAILPPAPADRLPLELLGTRVKDSGVAGTIFNTRRQYIGIRVFMPGPDYIEVLYPEAQDPFTRPPQPINRLLQFSAETSLHERVHVRGVVTHPGFDG